MRSLESLVRLARFKVEELQKQMADVDAARADLARQVDRLDQSVPEEQVAANASRDGFVAYGSYAQAVIRRKQNLRASIAEVDGRAEGLRRELAHAFEELKRFEVLEERRAASIAMEKARRDQAVLDEVAGRKAM